MIFLFACVAGSNSYEDSILLEDGSSILLESGGSLLVE